MYATKSSSIDFQDPPAGMHHAVCYRVIDLGTQQTEWQGKSKQQRKVLISWELPYELMEPYTDGEGKEHPARPFTVHKRYTLSFFDRAQLRQHLESWRGRSFTDAELSGPPDGFYMKDLLGVNCQLNLVSVEKNGNTYTNIEAVVPLTKGMEKKAAHNTMMFLDTEQFDEVVFGQLSEGLQDTIRKSPEYAEAMGRGASHNQDTQSHNTSSGPRDTPPADAYADQAAASIGY